MGCCALVSSLAAANPRHISPSAVFDDLWTVRQLGGTGTAVSPARTQAAWRRASVAVA
jgi:hypothetical protein